MNGRFEPAESTILYYDVHGDEYCASTRDLDMELLYSRFLPHVPPSGCILDSGSGSGRDSKAFLERGYSVVSIDASEAMAAATSRLTGQAARLMTFDEMPFVEEFDGIWACASVLHVSRAETPRVWANFIRALKTEGVWYLSFKLGTNEEFRNGRLFNDHTESSLVATIDSFPGLTIIDIWQSPDVRSSRSEQKWINAVLRRGPGLATSSMAEY
jgi:SAM-dependent methyltransferase